MSEDLTLRFSTLNEEGPLQVSKWLKIQMLVDIEEIKSLFSFLGEFLIYNASTVCKEGQGIITQNKFLDCYADYINALKNGRMPEESFYRQCFSSVFTVSPDSLYAVKIGEGMQLIRIRKPVIQLQSHRLNYSSEDGKFRSMTLGTDSIVWGIQFSYPQLYLNNRTKEIENVMEIHRFANTSLFRSLQKWTRQHTIPTPFFVNHERINVPMRLGKQCISWINKHPQLIEKNIHVVAGESDEH